MQTNGYGYIPVKQNKTKQNKTKKCLIKAVGASDLGSGLPTSVLV